MKNTQKSAQWGRSASRRHGSPWWAALGLLPLLALVVSCVSVPAGPRGRGGRTGDVRREPPPRSLPIPVQGVRKSQLQDTWGAPRSGGRRHEGIDIFAVRNTPVMSTTRGYVSSVGRNGLGGLIVSVTGPGGWRHYYAHLERWGNVREGQWVEAGTVIGYVGNSGNARSTPPHLHYGIYQDRGAINPYPLLVNGPGTVVARQPTPGTGPAPAPDRRAPTGVEDEIGRRARALGERILRDVLEGNND